MSLYKPAYGESIKIVSLILFCVSISAGIVWGPVVALAIGLGFLALLARQLAGMDFTVKSPEVLLLFLIMGTIGFGRGFSYLGIRIEETTVYVTELVLAATWGLVLLKKFAAKEGLIKKSPLGLVFLFYYAIGLLCLLRGLPDFGMEAARHSVVVYYSLFYFLILELITDFRGLERFLKYSLMASVVALVAVFYNFIIDIGVLTPQGIKGYGGNIGSLSLAFCFFFWLSLNIFKVKCKAKSFLGALVPIQILAVFLAQHRSLLLAMAGGLVFILAAIDKARVFKYVVFSLCALMLILSADYLSGALSSNTMVQNTLQRIYTIATPQEDPNSAHRIAMWAEILDRAAGKPLLGEGFGPPFSVLFGTRFYDYLDTRLHPHNSFLWILNRMGIIGLGIFLFLILRFYRVAIRAYQGMIPGKPKAYLLALMSCHVCLSIFAFFNVVLEGPFMGIFFWITMGLVMALINIHNNQLGQDKHELEI